MRPKKINLEELLPNAHKMAVLWKYIYLINWKKKIFYNIYYKGINI